MYMKIPMYIKLTVISLVMLLTVTACGYSVRWQDATVHNPNIEVGVVATTAEKNNNLGIREQPKALRREPLVLPKESDTKLGPVKKIPRNSWESLNPGFLLLAPLLGITVAMLLDIVDKVARKRRRKKRAKVESEETRPADEI